MEIENHNIKRYFQLLGIFFLLISIYEQFDNYFRYPSILLMIVFFIGIVFTIYDYRNYDESYDMFFVINSFIFLFYCFNFDGHDYRVYSENLKLGVLNDFPFSYVIMRIFTFLFGNPNGLYILSVFCVMIIYVCYHRAFKVIPMENSLLLLVFPFIFFGNQGLKYISGGVLRNVIALSFTILMFSSYNLYEYAIPVFLSLTHIPTYIYYFVYRFIHGEKRKEMIRGYLVTIPILIIGALFISGEMYQSIYKIFEIFYDKFTYYPFYFKRSFSMHGWNRYMITILSVVLFFFYEAFIIKHKVIRPNVIMMLLTFIPYFNWHIMLRLVFLTWFNIFNILIYYRDETDNLYNIFIILLAIEGMGARLP